MGSRDDRSDDIQKAIDLYLSILAANPDESQARMALKAVSMKRAMEQGATMKLRLPQLRKMLDRDKKMAGNDSLKLIRAHQKYLSQDPFQSAIRTALAELLLAQGYFSGAAAEAEMAIKDDRTNVHAASLLVSCYEKLGMNREASVIKETINQFKGPSQR